MSSIVRGVDNVDSSNVIQKDSNGNVGIGTSSVGGRLHLKQSNDSYTSGLNIQSASNAAVRLYIGVDNATATTVISNDNHTMKIESTGANPLTLRTNGTEKMRIDSSGNVGIGTTPIRKFHIHDASLPIIQLTNSTTGNTDANRGGLIYQSGAGMYLTNKENGTIYLGNNGLSQVQLDASGNVGIGVTPSAWSSAQKVIQSSNASFYGYGAGVGGLINVQNAYWGGSSFIYTSNGYATQSEQTLGQHIWRTAPSGTAGNAITWNQAMTLDASGVLNINSTASNGRINIGASSNYIYGDASNNIILGTAGSDRVTIKNNGNLLIGTPTDNGVDKLQVNGSIKANSIAKLSGANNPSSTFQFLLVNNSAIKLTIWSTNDSTSAKYGEYSFVGLYKGAGINPLVTTIANMAGISFAYTLSGGADTLVTVTVGTDNQGYRWKILDL